MCVLCIERYLCLHFGFFRVSEYDRTIAQSVEESQRHVHRRRSIRGWGARAKPLAPQERHQLQRLRQGVAHQWQTRGLLAGKSSCKTLGETMPLLHVNISLGYSSFHPPSYKVLWLFHWLWAATAPAVHPSYFRTVLDFQEDK